MINNRFIIKIRTSFRIIKGVIAFPYLKKRYSLPHILSIEETIDIVLEKKLSVARFGDSEYMYMSGKEDGLQKYDKRLQEKLKAVFLNKNDLLKICLVDYHDMHNIKTFTRKLTYMMFYTLTYKSYYKLLDFEYEYGNSNMTRFYMAWKDKSHCTRCFDKCKLLWDKRNIVLFEGENTRFGYKNDLFDNAKSIKRVLCPSKQAFEKYDDIYTYASSLDKDHLLIFALGATATVLASELSSLGYQSIDIGNLDVEYEWFKLGATEKIALQNKQVSEVSGGVRIQQINDEAYLSQIIHKIGV